MSFLTTCETFRHKNGKTSWPDFCKTYVLNKKGKGEYMAEEVTSINEVKTSSDGTVRISVETYNDLLTKANRPSVINRTNVVKTAEMAAKDYRLYGGTLMGLGATLFVVGARLYAAGRV